MVLVRAKALGQHHKIADKLEQNPYVVISQMDNQPLFKVQPRGAKDQEGIKIFHWNILYPIQTVQNDGKDSTAGSSKKRVKALVKIYLLMDLHFADVLRGPVFLFREWVNRGMFITIER